MAPLGSGTAMAAFLVVLLHATRFASANNTWTTPVPDVPAASEGNRTGSDEMPPTPLNIPCVSASSDGACTCSEGYELDPWDATNTTCRPACNRTCVNAICTVSRICTCLEGYHLDPTDESNSTCVLLGHAMRLSREEEHRHSGRVSPQVVAGAALAAATIVLTLTVAATVYWMKRRDSRSLLDEEAESSFTNPPFQDAQIRISESSEA